MCDDGRNPEIDELEVGQVRLGTTQRLFNWVESKISRFPQCESSAILVAITRICENHNLLLLIKLLVEEKECIRCAWYNEQGNSTLPG